MENTLINEYDEKPPIYERLLLSLAGLFITINFIILSILRPQAVLGHILMILVWSVCAWVGNYGLNRLLPHRDRLLFPLVIFLSGWGLVMIDRLEPTFADRQAVWLMLSVLAMLLVAATPKVLMWLKNYRYLWLTFGLTLLISTILLGSNPSGLSSAPQLWLGFGDIYFQPSEALKIILVVFLASYLAEQYRTMRAEGLISGNRWMALSPRLYGPTLLMWGLSIVILIWQRDLGTAVVFFGVFLVLIYTASGYSLVLISGIALITIAAVAAYYLFDVVQLRVDIWLNPWADADGDAYQLVQSLQAFAAGGIIGEGIGLGYPNFIPVVHSDFVFAALAEEWGLIGTIVAVCCLFVLVVRGMIIATYQQGQPFKALMAVGFSTLIGVQSLLIMGGVTRLFPLTGVTLPFMSYGGSSLLMSFIMIGLLLRLSEKT
ncbi:MAG: cell cycle protein [Phototrophicales bacterium]|nr:MAG: cell cycle protein [Phototrophicales bacterium]